MQAPPTRYKVVERGRRLEVIDTWTGEVATPQTRAAEQRSNGSAPPVTRAMPATLTQRGQRILRTAPWYDAKGPREIVLNQAAEGKLKAIQIGLALTALILVAIVFNFWPLLFIAGFTLARGTVRQQLRTAATRIVDDLDQTARRG